jgi:hypothetical protein
MLGLLMNNKFEKQYKIAAVHMVTCYPRTYLYRLKKKTMKIFHNETTGMNQETAKIQSRSEG